MSLVQDMQDDAERVDTKTSDGTMKDLVGKGEEMIELTATIEITKTELKDLTRRYDELRKELIPEAMQVAGLVTDAGKGKYSTASGATVSLRGDMFVGIQRGQEETAHEWLRKNGHGALIKPTVHSSTLRAFGKEQTGLGKPLPETLFNVFAFTYAVITKPRS